MSAELSGVVVASIEAVHARQILDSRGNPTLEVEVDLDDGSLGRAAAPSGASTGAFEAVELRDGGDEYGGKAITKAVQGIIDEIQPELLGFDADDQRLIDQAMIDLDRTPDKSRLGANAITGVSMAVAHAAARSVRLPLFRYLGGPNAHVLPVPMMNILNGGAHADNSVDIQEFMIAPIGAASFAEAVQWGAETYHALKSVLKQHGLSTGVGDEGGFAPDLANNRAALDLIVEAVGKAGFTPGLDVALAIDAAATEFYAEDGYRFEGAAKDAAEMTRIYTEWLDAYPIVSLEDPLSEEDWAGWQALTAAIGDRVQIVGDDLFVTNPVRLLRGIAERSANALLVKVNQIGSISETLDAVSLAQRSGFACMISHRSGETDDTTISDLAVAVNAGQIKSGAPARGERVAKYNQLMRIEDMLDDAAVYAGASAFPRWTPAD
jgi:enolase